MFFYSQLIQLLIYIFASKWSVSSILEQTLIGNQVKILDSTRCCKLIGIFKHSCHCPDKSGWEGV